MFNNKITKKGNTLDITESIFIFMGVVLTLFLVYTINDNFNDTLKNNDITNNTMLINNHEQHNLKMVKAWDWGVFIMALLFPVFSFIASRKIRTNPLMIILTIFVLCVIFLVSMIASNIYGAMLDNATFSSFIANTTFIPVIMSNLLYYSLIYAFIVVIGLFGKGEFD